MIDFDSVKAADNAIEGMCQCNLVNLANGEEINQKCPRCRIIERVVVALNKAERAGIARGRVRADALAREVATFLSKYPLEGPPTVALREAIEAFQVIDELSGDSARLADGQLQSDEGLYHAILRASIHDHAGNILATESAQVGVRRQDGPQRVVMNFVDHHNTPIDLTNASVSARVGILRVDGEYTWLPTKTHLSPVTTGSMEVEFTLKPLSPVARVI